MRIDATIEPEPTRDLAGVFYLPVKKGFWEKFVDSVSHKYWRRLWNRRNLVPDRYGSWRKDVIRTVLAKIESGQWDPDAIVTFAQPFSDHLIGLELKRRLGLPWLAHFSDPWADNPFTPYDRQTLALNLELERRVAENADLLAFTSAETIDLFCRKYPEMVRQKARVLPQCFDVKRFSSDGRPTTDRLRIRYLGNFYGGRTPRPLISGLTKIYERDPDSLRGVSFELIGAGDLDEVAALTRELPNGLVSARSSVDYSESLCLMTEADGLMVIDAPSDLSVFLPSKLIDYIGSGRPIFGLTPKGTAADLINKLGGSVADPSDESAIAEGIAAFIGQLRSRRTRSQPMPWGESSVRHRFSVENVVEEFDRLLAELKALSHDA